MGAARGLGTRGARLRAVRRRPTPRSRRGWSTLLAEHDDALLAAYVDDETARLVPPAARASSRRRPRRALVHPVFFGSAITGAGVDALIAGIARAAAGGRRRRRRPGRGHRLQGRARPGRGEDRLRPDVLRDACGRATGCGFGRTSEAQGHRDQRVRPRRGASGAPSVAAGQIGKLWGLGDVRIGDAIGDARDDARSSTTSRRRRWRRSSCPCRAADQRRAARRARPARRAGPADQPAAGRRCARRSSVSLYGEVQKEVIQATLADDFGVDVDVPRDDDDLHRAAGRHRRGGRDHRQGRPTRSSPRSGCASSRRRSAAGVAFRLEVELGLDAARVLQGGRGDRARDAAPGAPRLAGHRLRGHA